MATDSGLRGRRRTLAVLVVLVAGWSGCSTDSQSTDSQSIASQPVVSGSNGASGERPAAGSSMVHVDGGSLDEVTVVAELGYPRDLLDRNRVNLVVTRPSDERFEVLTKQLRMTGYEPSPPEERRTVIPPNGRRVALQTLLGEVSDCDTDAEMSAAVDITYRWGESDELLEGSVPVDDVSTLVAIWQAHCMKRIIEEDFSVEFTEVDVDGEEMTTTLRIERVAGSEPLSIETVSGTVLVGVEVLVPPDQRTLVPPADALLLPLRIGVNRCDGHAVAESTRPYAVDLWTIAPSGLSQRVALDIDDIRADLAAMVAHCQQRTGSN